MTSHKPNPCAASGERGRLTNQKHPSPVLVTTLRVPSRWPGLKQVKVRSSERTLRLLVARVLVRITAEPKAETHLCDSPTPASGEPEPARVGLGLHEARGCFSRPVRSYPGFRDEVLICISDSSAGASAADEGSVEKGISTVIFLKIVPESLLDVSWIQ